MRFQKVSEHLLQFEAVRGACSREWQIADTLVMCTELDLAGYGGPPASPLASTRRSATPSFLRVSFARFRPDGSSYAVDLGVEEAMSAAEAGVISTYQMILREWIAGDRAGLPPGTSTRVADRYRNKG